MNTNIIFAVGLFVIPLICFLLFWGQVNAFWKDKFNRKLWDKVADLSEKGRFPSINPRVVDSILKKRHETDFKRENFAKRYDRIYRWGVIYRISIILAAFVWIIIFGCQVFCNKYEMSAGSFVILGVDGIYIFGLYMPSIIKLSKHVICKKIATGTENIMEKLYDPKGILMTEMNITANSVVMLLVNVLIFCPYLELCIYILNQISVDNHLVCMVIFLVIYQYLGVRGILTYILGKLFAIIDSQAKKNTSEYIQVEKTYFEKVLKNNTYLLYVLFYIVATKYKAYVDYSVGITVEAINIVFLLDTYFEKRKEIESKRN